MYRDNRLLAVDGLSVAGIIFSSYLTYYTFSSGQSACELRFLEMPSCFYGLVMYALIGVASVAIALAYKSVLSYALVALSAAGIIFSGSLTVYILSLGSTCVVFNFFGAPPCVLGLTMYTAVLLISVGIGYKQGSPAKAKPPPVPAA